MTATPPTLKQAKRAAQPKKARVESGKAAGDIGGSNRSSSLASKAKATRPVGSAGTYQLSSFDEDMTRYEKKKEGGDEGKATREGGFSLSSAYKMRGPRTGGGALKRSGKPSHHAFKSKSKHKRR